VRLAALDLEHLGGPPEGEAVGALVDLDDDGVAQAGAQALDPRLQVRLVLLGDVVVGVLLQVAELAGGLDPLRHLRARGSLEALELGAELLEALGRDRFAGRAGRLLCHAHQGGRSEPGV
jgi:hypothetical protein